MAEPEIDPVAFVNFGGNQRWYARRYRPRSEAELLDILGRHPGRTIKEPLLRAIVRDANLSVFADSGTRFILDGLLTQAARVLICFGRLKARRVPRCCPEP